jgi:hypothetical protein
MSRQIGLKKNPLGSRRNVEIFFIASFFIAGLIFALCLCRGTELVILSEARKSALSYASGISGRPASFSSAKAMDSYKRFESANPFRADLDSKSKQPADVAEPKTSADDLILVGTLPRIGAWINDGTVTRLVLRRQKIAGFVLADVSSGRALLTRDGDSTPLYMEFARGSENAPMPQMGKGPPPPAQKRPQPAGLPGGGIEPATPDKEGVVPRELVEKLLMDPYAEIAKMRMIPDENGGMRLERISPDSVLGSVGVKQGDVVKALNGIEIGNLGDVANAVNSMMSGTRFDVTVQRDGKPISLKYQVK